MSARGLFRATGKAAKPVAVLLEDGSIGKSDKLERERDDFYPTPPEPTRAFLHAELDRLKEFPVIWEPAAGDGAMVREMEAVGLNVFKSDLVDRGCGAEIRSFYEYNHAPAPALVTNPPFCEFHDDAPWVKHALHLLGCEYMAVLLPFNWPGAAERAAVWGRTPPARVYLMRWRIDFTGQGAPPMLNAWFVWDKQHKGETALRMLDRKDARQGELFGGEAA